MKLYTIRATFKNVNYFLCIEHKAYDHFLETDLSFEKNDGYSKNYFCTDKQKTIDFLNYLNNKEQKYNFEFDGHPFQNYYTYYDSFELVEISLLEEQNTFFKKEYNENKG